MNMLKGCVIENGLWFRLSGDPSDLIALHDTVRKIQALVIEYGFHDSDTSNLLVDFMKKIEHGYSGKTESVKESVYVDERNYSGFSCTWIELLICSNLMRLMSDYTIMDELDDINVQLLEYLTCKAISDIDKKEASGISQYIGKRFVCLDIKRFIAEFSCSPAAIKSDDDPDSFRDVLQYLNLYFEDNIPSIN